MRAPEHARSRGFTLLEVLMALTILTIAGLGTLQLITLLSRSNGNTSAQSEALMIARDLRAELENRPLLRTDLGDPEWAAGPHTAPPIAELTRVGTIRGKSGMEYQVQYQTIPLVPPDDPAITGGGGPDRDGDGAIDVSALDIQIVVRASDAVAYDAAFHGGQALATQFNSRLLRPVILWFRKDVQEAAALSSGGSLRW